MDKNRILIAFNDDEDIKVFSGYLSGMGFETSPVKDGARALELAIQEVPSVIITELDLPVIGGERIFQIIRNNPHTSKIPFLFISKTIADIKGFRTGVDIFLVRPINLEEVASRLRQTLSMKGAGTAGSKEIEGKLVHMSLADILQFLHLNKKEGELRITSDEGSGTVYIKDGQIYNCSLEGVEKEKALFRLLKWSDGKFEFVPKPCGATKKIRASTGNLLMEGMRQLDEFKKKEDQFPDKKAMLKIRIDTDTVPKGLQPIFYEILQLVKSNSMVEDIVERCSYPDYEVYSTLSNMIGRGILEELSQRMEGESEFLTNDQMISIREKIISRFSDTFSINYGKIFLLATSGRLITDFVQQCRQIPGLQIDQRSAFSNMEHPLGTVATLRLYGGLELAIFSIPSIRNMAPLWRAFSTHLVGLILLWDSDGASDIKELVTAKKEILLRRRVPVAHIFAGTGPYEDESGFKKAFNLRIDEPLFKLSSDEKGMAAEVFYGLFSALLKDDYVTA
ncbi:MAG: DUF4388 domain-containing protein [Deltaproteobacteria bacterium]|nr:DUF4388 domain-containing protein [Deltaproteobacteria bacterium]